MLPRRLRLPDRLKLARDVGFDGIEAIAPRDEKEIDALRAAADGAGIAIHAVRDVGHRRSPLSSADPEVAGRGLDGLRASIRAARILGAGAVTCVAGVVTAETPYREAWARSRAALRSLLSTAEDDAVAIALENGWHKFLLSPIEFAAYADELASPRVAASIDAGAAILLGYPQDWIRTLGARIRRVRIRDFDARKRQFVPLLEGSVDWGAVRTALIEIGYDGPLTAHFPRGNEPYLREVGRRMDRIIRG